ncbi:hypothetical protein GPECTOR_9g551 [Gonium pectorale]|uniref:Uncharacterized protein n=1 Tax=Gonium pectorale TaxID=33097 RepID=A0A150GRR2_GONPE|nr:hypothetical protein GPECTOR_9g551 [Gonium pectorale]|eukprot:KXZ52507.1 hypothetical protein GPECTOR_9g551 [Gonium pectorale]
MRPQAKPSQPKTSSSGSPRFATMTFVLRAAAGQPNFRPRAGPKADHRPRAASSAAGPVSSGQTPAPAPSGAPAGGFPIWCVPLLAAAVAMPIYGYKTQMKLIDEARARQRASVVTAATAPAATKTGK